MIRLPPPSTRTDTPFPAPPLFRSVSISHDAIHTGTYSRARSYRRVPERAFRAGRRADARLSHPGHHRSTARYRRVFRIHLVVRCCLRCTVRSEEHTSELQSLMRISYAVFCLKKKKTLKASHELTIKRIQ